MRDGHSLYIGASLKRLRRAVGLNQSELAKKLGVSRVSVSNLETGLTRIRRHRLPLLAEILKVSVEDLLDLENGSDPSALVKVIQVLEGDNGRLHALIAAQTAALKAISVAMQIYHDELRNIGGTQECLKD